MSGALAKALARGGQRNLPSLAVRLGLDSGVHRLLETPLIPDGAAEPTRLFALVGGDASAGGWTTRNWPASPVTLALQAGTAPTYDDTSPLLGSLDESVRINGGGWYLTAESLGDLTTEDLIVEALVEMPPAAGDFFGTFSTRGWLLYAPAANNVTLYGQGPSAARGVSITGVGAGRIVLLHGFIDVSANGLCYHSGTAGTVGDMSGLGSLTSTGFAAGNRRSGSEVHTGRLMYGSAWKGTLDSHLNPVCVARRNALCFGSRPSFSIVPSTYPTAAGSTSPVYQQRRLASGADQLFYMGAGAPTFDRIVDAAGRAVVGHLVEIAGINVALQSQVAATSRTAVDATLAANSDTAPDGTLTADTLTASASPGYNKQVFAAITAVARVESYWVRRNGAANVAGKLQIIKTSNGATIAEVAFTATALWQKVQIVGTCVLNDTETRLVIDTNTESLFIWQEDFVAGDYAGSGIVTTTAAVTRAASSCKYSLTNALPRTEGTLLFGLLARSFTPTRNRVLFSLDDGSANNRLEVWTDTSGRLNALSRKAAGTDGDAQIAGSVFDNAVRRGMLSWREGCLDLWLRSAAGVWTRSQDTTVTPPAGATLTTLCVCHDNATANQAGPGLYPLAGWQLLPGYYPDPEAVKPASDTLWGTY